MATFLYRNPKTGEIKEIVQGVHEKHEYSEGGVKYEREFTSPNTATNTQWDPRNPKDYVEKTRSKRGTLKVLFETSVELREKRLEKDGHDPHREKYYEDYSKKRRGKKLQVQQREEFMKNPPKGFDIEL